MALHTVDALRATNLRCADGLVLRCVLSVNLPSHTCTLTQTCTCMPDFLFELLHLVCLLQTLHAMSQSSECSRVKCLHFVISVDELQAHNSFYSQMAYYFRIMWSSLVTSCLYLDTALSRETYMYLDLLPASSRDDYACSIMIHACVQKCV